MSEIIAERTLKILEGSASVDVPVRLFAPRREVTGAGEHWECDIEIGWPGGTLKHYAGGLDSMQAVELAMKLIGVELYTSEAHESGRLIWTEQSLGYGFPVTSNLRDKLVGDDAKYL